MCVTAPSGSWQDVSWTARSGRAGLSHRRLSQDVLRRHTRSSPSTAYRQKGTRGHARLTSYTYVHTCINGTYVRAVPDPLIRPPLPSPHRRQLASARRSQLGDKTTASSAIVRHSDCSHRWPPLEPTSGTHPRLLPSDVGHPARVLRKLESQQHMQNISR